VLREGDLRAFPRSPIVFKAMAELFGNLWEHNLAKIIVVDVTDDYRLMQPPMPTDFYPVLREVWMPRYMLSNRLPEEDLVTGYLYDWHQRPETENGWWYVGVVDAELARTVEERWFGSA
jgi:hypothetical protein